MIEQDGLLRLSMLSAGLRDCRDHGLEPRVAASGLLRLAGCAWRLPRTARGWRQAIMRAMFAMSLTTAVRFGWRWRKPAA